MNTPNTHPNPELAALHAEVMERFNAYSKTGLRAVERRFHNAMSRTVELERKLEAAKAREETARQEAEAYRAAHPEDAALQEAWMAATRASIAAIRNATTSEAA